MTQEEKMHIESEAQKICELWANLLNMQEWLITIKAVDEIMNFDATVFDTFVYNEIGQAKIEIPTKEIWDTVYRDIPYRIENYLVMQMLRIKFHKNGIRREDLSYLATCIIELKLRGDRLERIVHSLQAQLNAKTMDEPVPEPEPESEVSDES